MQEFLTKIYLPVNVIKCYRVSGRKVLVSGGLGLNYSLLHKHILMQIKKPAIAGLHQGAD